jgi:hypothetical protein
MWSNSPGAAVDHEHAAKEQRSCDCGVQQGYSNGVLHNNAHHILDKKSNDEEKQEHPTQQRNLACKVL